MLTQNAEKVARLLTEHDRKVVLAESCTCGLIAATLGLVPGISQYLCGSAVVYREQTKMDWLGVSSATLAKHTAVSSQASDEIAYGVLLKSAEADVSLGITGHFGPNAPDGLDGAVFLAVWSRKLGELAQIDAAKKLLTQVTRPERQTEAAAMGLDFLSSALERL